MLQKRLRFVLPVLRGFVSIALIGWDTHNTAVIESMGMAWDTGAPIWPYQTPRKILMALNAPSYAIATPVFMTLGPNTYPLRYLALFPIILLWWWALGTRMDRGLVSHRKRRFKWLKALLLAAISFGLFGFAVYVVINQAEWWFQYGDHIWSIQGILLLPTAGVTGWCFFLGVCATLAALRVASFNENGKV